MSFELHELPYGTDALEPHISAQTLEFHHGKHHQGYIDKLNRIIDGTPYATQSLVSVIQEAAASGDQELFNNAAQSWNHDFLWHSMAPGGGGSPDGRLADLIADKYGDIDGFRQAFRNAATAQFGSGWTWLIFESDSVSIYASSNSQTPVARGVQPLLALDVWEHAYYLDYQNERARYVDAFLEHLVNWEFAAANLQAGTLQGEERHEKDNRRTASGAA